MRFSVFSAGVLAFAALVAVPASANAATFTLGTCLTGDCGSVTGSVLVSITDNTSDPNAVDFQVDNNTNGDIDYLNFSYSSVAGAGSAAITDFTTSGTTGAPAGSFTAGTDASLAYDVKIDFPNAAASRLGVGESVAFTLGSLSGFDFDASGFSPVLAHIISLSIGGQSVKLGEGGGTGGGGSTGGGGQTIPEPTSMALFGLAALSLVRRGRRTRM